MFRISRAVCTHRVFSTSRRACVRSAVPNSTPRDAEILRWRLRFIAPRIAVSCLQNKLAKPWRFLTWGTFPFLASSSSSSATFVRVSTYTAPSIVCCFTDRARREGGSTSRPVANRMLGVHLLSSRWILSTSSRRWIGLFSFCRVSKEVVFSWNAAVDGVHVPKPLEWYWVVCYIPKTTKTIIYAVV